MPKIFLFLFLVVLQGEYGENDVAMGVPVIINQHGVSKIEEMNS